MSIPPAPQDGGSGAHVPPPESNQARNVLIALGFIGTILVLVFVLFSEHHRHE
jgi:hypothetical protein